MSRLAEADFREIGQYSRDNWGTLRADAYLSSLTARFEQLAAMPLAGRSCQAIRFDTRRAEHESHVIFYRVEHDGILVARILHRRMLPSRRSI